MGLLMKMTINKKVIRLHPDLEKVLNGVKNILNLPNVRGTDQIAQIKLAEFAKMGMNFNQTNKNKLGGKPKIVKILDSVTF